MNRIWFKRFPHENFFGTVLIKVLAVLAVIIAVSGCSRSSYPEDKIESAIKEICLKEYKVPNVEVKFAGGTIGVFLPLQKLFATDVRQEILSGNVGDLESLFEPEPQAMDQLENVLFTISRVLLSSDKPIDFYVLQATDVESTGLQLVLVGYVADVRRVRLWDISRSEYRKRVLHELKFNRSVLWEKPVRQLFSAAGQEDVGKLMKRYFSVRPTSQTTSFFYDVLMSLASKQNVQFELEDVKSRSYRDSQALVYVKVRERFDPKPGVGLDSFSYPSGMTLEYIFVVEPYERQFRIVQVIPFYYLDETRQLRKVPLPPELDLGRNLESWPERFEVEEITVGEFLARQLNRRVQTLVLADERIHHTVRHAQVNFTYRDRDSIDLVDKEPHFALYFDFMTKGMKRTSRTIEQVVTDEDVLYLFELILREFADLVRSYQFKDYDYLKLIWEPGDHASALKLDPVQLDLFRSRKLNISALLESPSRSIFTPS